MNVNDVSLGDLLKSLRDNRHRKTFDAELSELVDRLIDMRESDMTDIKDLLKAVMLLLIVQHRRYRAEEEAMGTLIDAMTVVVSRVEKSRGSKKSGGLYDFIK